MSLVTGTLQEVGVSYQHLVDDKVIRHSAGCRRELTRPVKYPGNPILYPDEQVREQYVAGRPIWDESENRFVMWYNRVLRGGETTLRYATSEDGITWDFPSLGLYEENGSKDNNVLADETGQKICTKAQIFLNPRKEPGKKYVGIFQPWHYCYGYSEDGIHWHVDTENPVWIRGSGDGLGECMSFVYDPVQDIWWGYVRVNIVDPVLNNANKRKLGCGQSKDMLSWTDPKIIYAADDDWGLDAQEYGWSPWFEDGKYWTVSHIFLTDIHPDPRLHQTIRPTLLHSDDGLNWRAVVKGEFLIPLGEPGDWDGMMLCPDRPIIKDAKTLFYYTGYLTEHGSTRKPTGATQRCGLGLAIGRQGGYASLKSLPGQEAVLITKPFALRGDQLTINAATHKGGHVKAELIDSGGSIVPQLGIAGQCDPFGGDSVDHLISWKGNTTGMRKMLGEYVRLRFRWTNAELYGFQICHSDPCIAELASGPAPLTCRKTSTPPVVDGILSDEVWENYGVIGIVDRFVEFECMDPAPVKTTMFVTYDDEAVYFAFSLAEPNADQLKAECKQGDPTVYNDDALQIELQPSGTREGPLTVLIFNSTAVKTTQTIDPKHAHSCRHDTSPGWQVATNISAGVWSAEVKLPFAVLGVDPARAGDRWRLNLHRFRCAGLPEKEIYSWVCTFGQFWRHDKRGELRFA